EPSVGPAAHDVDPVVTVERPRQFGGEPLRNRADPALRLVRSEEDPHTSSASAISCKRAMKRGSANRPACSRISFSSQRVSSSRRRLSTIAGGSGRSKNRPVLPSTTVSRNPPQRSTATDFPKAAASSGVSRKSSYDADTKPLHAAYSQRSCWSETCERNVTFRPASPRSRESSGPVPTTTRCSPGRLSTAPTTASTFLYGSSRETQSRKL